MMTISLYDDRAGVVGGGLIAFVGLWRALAGLMAASIAKTATMESKDEGSSSYQRFSTSLEESRATGSP